MSIIDQTYRPGCSNHYRETSQISNLCRPPATPQLIKGYRRILETIYNPTEYFQRALASLSQLSAAAQTPLVFSDPLAASRSIWRQGLLADYRLEYWKFMGQIFGRHRQRLARAFTLAIMGHHFFELVNAAIEE